MPISCGVKFRCYPTPAQATILSKWIGCKRFIYNSKVSEDRYFRTFHNHAVALTGEHTPVDQQYSQFKDGDLTPFLYDVPSVILRNGATRFMQACQRFFKGLADRPIFKKKNGRKTVWVTNELFRFESGHLFLGTKANPVRELKFTAHRVYDPPASLTISRHGGKWFVSFTQEIQGVEMTEAELIDHYGSMPAEELENITVGLDRGIVIPVETSAGKSYDLSPEQKKSLEKKEKRQKKEQRRLSRRHGPKKGHKGSNRWGRAARKVANCQAYAANVRNDFAHKTSRELVDSDAPVFVFEDLKLKNMTKKPKPKKDENGRYITNGAKAKTGLNKGLLESALGEVKQFTGYKARRRGKLTIVIPPYGTSQECSQCGHTHPDNRRSQSLFVCARCGFKANADLNAALVAKKRGIRALANGEIDAKEKKRTMRLKGKVLVAERATLGRGPTEVTHGETNVRRQGGNTGVARLSVNRRVPGRPKGYREGVTIASLIPRQLAAG